MTNQSKNSDSQSNSSLATISLVLGVVSLTGPGLFLGIPAVITGALALKRKEGERGMSITGIITGAISSVVSLLFIAFIIFLVVIGVISTSDRYYDTYYHPYSPERREMMGEGLST